jgi:transglutaminase-like putative cysteine protease
LRSDRVVTESFAGAPHTVEHIKRVALEAQRWYPLRQLAENIVGKLGSKDYLSEICAIYYWVCSNVRYANDPRQIELVRSPAEVLSRTGDMYRRLQGIVTAALDGRLGKWRPSLDCDDVTALLAALFMAMGREVRIVTVAFKNIVYDGKRQYQHVYIQVREPRSMQWIVVDPVAAENSGEMLRRVKAARNWPLNSAGIDSLKVWPIA